MYRIAFNPALPVIAAQPFTAAGQSFASKQPVDWRALGVSEQTLLQWWQGGLVSFAEAQEDAGKASEPVLEQPAPPTPQLTRRERRALRNQG